MNREKKIKIFKHYLFIGILSTILVLFGINYFVRPFDKYFSVEESSQEQVENQAEPTLLTRQNVFDELSVKEKIAQMIAYPLSIDEKKNSGADKDIAAINENTASDGELNKKLGFIEELSPGFIVIFGNKISFDTVKQEIGEVESFYKVNAEGREGALGYKDSLLMPKFAVDHEGGSVQRLSGEGFTSLPSWKEMCELENDFEMTNILIASAGELRNSGIDIVLSPVLDVGKSNILKDRICSDSYAVVASKSVEYASIFNSFGILPVLKHFPGIGGLNKDLHKNFGSIEVLVNDLKLYEYVIDESLGVAVMVSHAGITNQEPQIPCSLSKSCISELKEAYPQVLIFSDALEMKSASFDKDNVSEPKDLSRISKEAILAGNEILIYGESSLLSDIENIIDDLSLEYDINEEFKNSVDKSVKKIINYKYDKN